MTAQKMFEKLGWHKQQHNGYYTDYLWVKETEYDCVIDDENPTLLLFNKNDESVRMFMRTESIYDYSEVEIKDENLKEVIELYKKELGWL